MGFGVWGLGFGVEGLGLRVWVQGFRVEGCTSGVGRSPLFISCNNLNLRTTAQQKCGAFSRRAKAHRLLYHSTLGSRVIKKKKKKKKFMSCQRCIIICIVYTWLYRFILSCTVVQ